MESNADPIETHIARLETKFDHTSSEISEIKVDLRDLRKSTDAKFERVYEKFDAVNGKFDAVNERLTELVEKNGETKVWVLSSVGLGLVTLIAKAVHWI